VTGAQSVIPAVVAAGKKSVRPQQKQSIVSKVLTLSNNKWCDEENSKKRIVRRILSKLRHVVPFVDRTRYLQI
jgi:hypothetical protein